MSKNFTKWLAVMLFVLSGFVANAQTFTVTNEADLIAAINSLNTSGVATGGATVTFTANVSLTAALPTLGSAALNATTNSGNPLVIDGAGFSVTANYAGTRAGSITTGANDAVLAIAGTDYVTVQNLTFAEQAGNTTAAAMIENAIGVYNLSATTPFDGVQYLTITGCTFNMNKVTANALASTIYMTNYILGGTTSLAWATFATDPTQMHREITISNNIFNGSYNHVVWANGSANNGRNLTISGNTMNNIGGGAGSAYGVYTIRLDGLVFNNNVATTSTTQTSTNYVLFASTNCGGIQEAKNNTLTLRNATTTSQSAGIYFTSIGTSSTIEGNTLNFGSFSAITTATVYGFYIGNTGGVTGQSATIKGNTISGQALPGNNPTTTSSTFYGFYGSTSTTAATNSVCRIVQNTFTNNTRNGGGATYPIYQSGSVTAIDSGNVISNLTIVNNTTSSASTIYGINSPSTNPNSFILDNTISNISVSGTSTSTTSALRGIYSFLVSTSTVQIKGNTISNLSYGAGTHTGTVTGIHSATHLLMTINNNVISGLSATGTAGVVNGIFTSGDVTGNYYNNCISNLSAPQANSTLAIYGINISSGTTINASYNTIHIGDIAPISSSGTNFGVTGVYQVTTTALNLRNNIINIKGSPSGTGTFAALRRNAVGTAGTKPANLNPTNNIYYVTPSAASFLYVEGTAVGALKNGYATSGITPDVTNNLVVDASFNTGCGLYKLFMLEAGTFTEDNLVANGSCYSPTGASYAESNAATTTTPTITIDLATITRAATPDMGALEFAGIATDAVAPAISFSNIPSTICTTDAIFSATITDAAGINVTAGTAPRLWFKKSTENNAYNGNTVSDNGWKYVEALNTSSPFQFSMSLSLLNTPPVAGDVIQYFVTAQDLAATPNVAVNLAAFPSGFCPLTVALDPAAYPVTGAIKSFTILPDPVTVTSVSSQSTLCVSGTTTLSLSGDASTGAFYQWQSSPTGANTWTDIAGATTSTYTTASFSTSTDFRCEISCGDLVANGGSPITINNSTPVTVTVASPSITGTVPASRCGLGSMTLSATGSAGSTVNWYAAASGGSPLSLPYNNIAITGFNNDIVANGVGTNSIMGMTNTTVAVDGAGYCFIDNTFKYVSTNALPTCYMPINKQMTSLLTPSLTYQLQDYGTDVLNNNNVMTISNTSTTYTNPYSNTGTVTLTTPASYANLKVLYTSVMNVTGMVVDATITFTDATTQTISGNSTVNWFTSGSNAFTNVGRTTPAGVIQCAAAPYLFEMSLPISAGNQAKQVASVTFTLPQVITTGTTPASVNYFHVFAMGGQNVAVPGTYTTPVISTTTTYYASASVPGPNVSGGRMAKDPVSTGGALSGVPRGVIFTANTEGTLNEVGFLCTGLATTVTVQLYNAGGTATIGAPVTVSIPANAGTSTVPVLMTAPVSIAIPAPGTYRIFATAISTASSLYYEYSGVTGYPYNIGTDYSITGSVTSLTGTLGTTTYYYFYKLGFQSQCSSARVPVDATISAPPTLTVSGGATTECNNAVVTYDVSSTLADYDSYIWSPLTNLYTDAACTIAYTGTSASTIYLKSATAGTTTHTLNANNSVSGCSNSINVATTYMPATVTVTGNTDLCLSGTKTLGLTPITGISASNVQWKMNNVDISGANSLTYTTPSLTTTTDFSADIIDGNGNVCFTTATGTVLVNAPVVTGTTPGSRCGLGPVNLSASATGANGTPTLKWYTAATGGTPIGTGSPFATPAISTTTDFYVSAAEGTGGTSTIPGDGAWDHFTTTGGFQSTTITGAYAILTVLTPITLTSFDMYPSAAVGTAFTIEARTGSASGATFATYSGTTTVQNVTTPSVAQTVNTGWTLPAGTYYIGFVTNPSTWRSGAVTHSFPWVLPGVCSLDYYLTPSYQYYLYNLKVTGPCESARQAVTASVTTAPTITVSPNAAICQGFSTALTATSSNDPNYEYTWTPGALVGGAQTVSPANTTIYTVNAVDNVTGCATVGTTTVAVNQNPTAVTISNTTPAGCPGTAATLTATGGTIGGIFTLGTGTATNSASGTTPYSTNWENHHSQFLMTAAELNALGMVGGNINSLAFNVTALGTGYAMTNFTIKFGHTSATALTGYVVPTGGFTTCYGPLTLPNSLTTGWNTYNFASPFIWDGASNIVIDICHENDATNSCASCFGGNSTVASTATAVNTVYGSYADNTGACGITAATTVAANTNRPNMRFNSATPTTLTWTPTTALSTSTGTITVASPLATTDYTVTATSTDGCTATSSTTVTVLNCSSTLNLTLFLQGYYTGSNTMAEAMANQGYLPTPAVGDCDDITVELHDPVTTTTIAGTTTARLHADGTASASFTPGVTGNYYIVIKHRNSLQTWSTDPVTLSSTTSYNFTTAATQAYADQLVEVEPGVWAIYTGDLNQDDFIDSFDFPIFDLDASNGVSGVYVATDMNGDGFVDPFDFPVFDVNSFNGVSAIYP